VFGLGFLTFPLRVAISRRLGPSKPGVSKFGGWGWQHGGVLLETDHASALALVEAALSSLDRRPALLDGNTVTVTVGSTIVRSPWAGAVDLVTVVTPRSDTEQGVLVQAKSHWNTTSLPSVSRKWAERACRAIAERATAGGIASSPDPTMGSEPATAA